MILSSMNYSKAAICLGLSFCFCHGLLHAEQVPEDLALREHFKVVTVDATPNDPGQVEFWGSYVIQGGEFAWRSNGAREKRGTYLTQLWDTQTTVGIHKDIDVGIIQWFQHTLDKENNYNEVQGMFDPITGGAMEDTTKGPTHGFGWGDLGVTGHWRFYNSEEKKLEISYIPTVFAPTGRRSNFDHIGASQGYTSLDNSIALTKDIGRWNGTVNLGYNAPLAHEKRTNGYDGTTHANFAVGYQVFRWLQPETELIYLHDFGEHGKTANLASVVLGSIIHLSDHLRFEIGVQQDVFGSNKVQTTSGIFSVAFLT